jgi:hypothetical protein
MISLKGKRLRNALFLHILVTFSLTLVFSIVCLSSTANFAQTSANQMNTTVTNSTATPVGGFTGYAIAKKHVYDAPLLDVHIYCSNASGGILASCLLFDGNSTNATLIGIEYIISSKQYASLPDREKPIWTPVAEEAESDLRFPNLTPQEIQGFFKQLEGAYIKLIITWDPQDNLPLYPPQVIVESLIGHNETK